jgi:hypothetical protein
MENININNLLDRDEEANRIKTILKDFELNKNDLLTKKGLYIYGDPGSGKTTFVTKILKELDYDIIKYDAGDIRNKSIIDTITKHNMSDKNVLSMFHKKIQRIAIIMDEIDGMNNGDKGGINSLIKMIRPKKTKKQKLEEISLTPIICVSSFHVDKKIKELMKVCHVFQLNSPNTIQMEKIIDFSLPTINRKLIPNMITYLQYDLRKLTVILSLYKKNNNILNEDLFENILKCKSYNEDTKEITQKIFNNNYSINEHTTIMNDTDRTIVGLLWHENIIDILNRLPSNTAFPLYNQMLDKICFADYIDRITFQKQIWQFNEMSSLIKTFSTNSILHKNMDETMIQEKLSEIRFTKVLTKYSTEYNNSLFIQELCQKLSLDKKDMFSFFIKLKSLHSEEELCDKLETYEITKLDISRIYRYIDKYTNDKGDDTYKNKNGKNKNADIEEYDMSDMISIDPMINSYQGID